VSDPAVAGKIAALAQRFRPLAFRQGSVKSLTIAIVVF
jgi:hypothetical protein